MITGDGNLKLTNGKITVWSTEVAVQSSNNSVAVLLDVGNFVLKDNSSGDILWESFSNPGDTFLPGMKIGINAKTGEKRFLVSSKSKDDPSPGNFVGGVVAQSAPIIEAFIWENGNRSYSRSGQWNGVKFIGIPQMNAVYLNGMGLLSNSQEGTWYFTLNDFNNSLIRFLYLSPVGSLQITNWDEGSKEWNVGLEVPDPDNKCDIYGACGPNGICNNKDKSPICKCWEGFEPKSHEEWNRGNWTDGCVRRIELLCDKINTSLASSSGDHNKPDGFLKLSGVKLPDRSQYQKPHENTEEGCRFWCLNNCSCMAYGFVTGIGCMFWTGDLMDVQSFSYGGEDLFIRVAYAEIGKKKNRSKVIFPVAATSTFIIACTFLVYGFLRWRLANNRKGKSREALHESDIANAISPLRETPKGKDGTNIIKQKDSLIFEFKDVIVATNNFSLRNKLGEGGFGPVYKGKLQNGNEIAVKRLSSHSGQGMEEFKNEIVLISRLQHRNLVRLLGCCVEGEEKLLIYEYMPNKSLDTFLFDSIRKTQLVWNKRFSIIQGIARGLLYLHRDSFLRVIHRDLKTSNVLLDEDMNPKISDFGLARTFQKTQDLGNTHRVVGTLGYMPPEYIMGGRFSEKSDVFSFGVLVLEIVSGERISGFQNDEHLNLAWRSWCEDRVVDLIDKGLELEDSFCLVEVKRCVHVGLLCVQENPADRPNMPTVILQLNGGTGLPQPKQPAFVFQSSRDDGSHGHGSNSDCKKCSINEVTFSATEGR
ncbi:S-locus glycoprotein [Corchorus capsularis]|uniref:Receptor-like serine/threonine-protein kinase n=1 Tax=Corchorus capsularis TaxID=210143 RepID=A0A1R3I0S0_COCAP|nr:S-locus glycoprotein [Corchorus capsularis]